MDINNNQQIHTFSKGMNSDTSDMYLSNELYRYAENLRYSTNKDSNSGELRLIEGTAPIILPAESDMWEEILAMTSIRDYLIVVGKRPGNKFNIYKKNLGESLGVDRDKWTRLFVNDLTLDPKVERINLLGRWESDKNIKLYMVDGVHPLMCVRLDDSNAQLQDIDNVDDLSPQINYLLPPPQVRISERAGQLKPAKIQYAYTLSDDSGMETSLSILSNSISLYNGNRGYSIKESLITDSAIDINIPYRDETKHLSNIKLYRITYRQGGQQPLIELFYDGKRKLQFIDTGSTIIKTLSVEEFLSIIKLGIIPQEIESKDEYLFIGNTKYTQDLVDLYIKEYNIDCTAPSGRTPSDGPSHCYRNKCKFFPEDWYKPGTTTFGGKGEYFEWEFVFDDLWVALDNTTLSTESLNIYNPDRKSLRRGEIYRYGVILYDKHGRASSPKFVADIMVPPGDGTYQDFKVVQKIQNIDDSTDWDSSLNTTVGGLLSGYRGRTRSGTINMDGSSHTTSFSGSRASKVAKKYLLRSIGVNFKQIKLFDTDIISGWQIIRVRRNISDKINIVLGIIGSPELHITTHELKINNYTKYFIEDTLDLCPKSLFSMQMTVKGHHVTFGSNMFVNYYISDPSVCMFTCPEYCYQEDDIMNILPEAEQLKTTNVVKYNIEIFNRKSESGTKLYIPDGYIYDKHPQYLKYIYTTFDDNYWNIIKQTYNLQYDRYLDEHIFGYENLSDNNKCPSINIQDDEWVLFSLNHLYPININDNLSFLKNDVILLNISYAHSQQFNSFAKSEGTSNDKIQLTYRDSTYFAGTKSFVNWSLNRLLECTEDSIKDILKGNYPHNGNLSHGPKCMLLLSMDPLGFGYYHITNENSNEVFPISVVNISRINPIPYGGEYIESDTKDVYLEKNYISESEYSNESVNVFDGDCFIGMFTINTAHIWKDSVLYDISRVSTVYTVPLESDINLKATCGDLYPTMTQDLKFHQLDYACIIKYPRLTYVQQKDAYLYNTAYSKEEDLITNSIIKYKTTDSNNHDCRIHYSQPKVNGQDPDPWPIFKPVNYIDVDDRYGAITGLKLFKDKLIFWQENATGVLSVNEKAITQATNGSDIILGTSDVMLRYDYISTIFGMYKHQHAFAESSSLLYWWDSYNKEILQLGDGLTQLTRSFGLENYINTRTESTHPSISYDLDYDEILCNVVKNETLVFSEKTKLFTSVYTFAPRFSATIDGNLYLSDNVDIYKMDAQLYKLQSYLFGNKAYPLLLYTVNANSMYPKTFDILTIGANFYSGDLSYEEPVYANDNGKLKPLQFKYKTPLNLSSWINGLSVSNREYDFRLDIPRDRVRPKKDKRQVNEFYGDRMRGKIMQCELSSTSNSTDFSLQYIITKYRMSWS